MRRATYDVILEPDEQGGFAVYAPALPGCISEGDTEDEALENIADAISEWLRDQEEQVKAEVQANSPRARRVTVGE